MKKIGWIIVFVMLITLSSCITISSDNLEISLNPGVDTVEVGSAFIDAGASANYGFRTLTPTIIENTVDTSSVGVYEIIYEISYLDFVKSVTRMVTVIDHTPPVLTLNPGVDTIVVGQTWIDAGVAIDENSSDPVDLTVSGTVNSDVSGEYMITYHAEDASGNTSEIIRYVNVIDLTN